MTRIPHLGTPLLALTCFAMMGGYCDDPDEGEGDVCLSNDDCANGFDCVFENGTLGACTRPGGGDGFHETCSDPQVCTGGSDVNLPPAATEIKSFDVISSGGLIEAKIVFNGDAEAHDAATDNKFPFSLQFNMTGGGPDPEAYFIEKAKMKMSNQGNIVSYIFFGDTLKIEIDGVSLPDVKGIQASSFYDNYSVEDGSEVVCSQLCKSPNP
jgi:hypothetical protein